MTDYKWPSDLVPYAVSFYLQPHTGGSESPFNKQTKVYGLSAPRWICRMSFRGGYNGTTAQNAFGPRLDAMIAKLKGRQNRVELFDWRRPTLRSPLSPPGNNAASTGATSMVLTGLVPGTIIYAGDYIGGDGRPHIITEDVISGTTATVTFEPPLQAPIAADSAVFGNPTGTFRLTSDDAGENGVEVGTAAIYTLEFVEDPAIPSATLFSRTLFGWNEDPAFDSARFASTIELAPGAFLTALSPRDAPTNDAEIGMRLDVLPWSLDDSGNVTKSPLINVETPTGYTSGVGAAWAGNLLRLPTGRILLFYMFLNSPDGTYTNNAARMDICLRYSDDNGLTWSAKQTLVSGETDYTSFGVPDQNFAQAGLNVAGGVNHVVRLPSGRIVLTGQLAAPTSYIASIYTDDPNGTSGWTFGTPLAFNSSNDNEVSVAVTSTGSLLAFVRNEGINRRAIYQSANGQTWSYVRNDTNLAIRNVASASLGLGDGKVLVGGATMAGDNRKGYELFRSTNDGTSFSSTPLPKLFLPIQRIGYSHLNRLSSGKYLLTFEETSVQSPGSFNQKGSIGVAVFDDRHLSGMATDGPPHDSQLYDAAAEKDKYVAWVTADGGTVQDATAVQTAISQAIAGNYYSSIGFAVSARWGHKGLGSVNAKLYSLNRITTSEVSTAEFVALNTTTHSHATIQFNGSAALAWIQFNGMVLRQGGKMGCVIADGTSGLTAINGTMVTWPDGGANYFLTGSSGFLGADVVKHAPTFPTAGTKAAGFFYDFDELLAVAWRDGSATHAARYFPHPVSKGETANVRIRGEATSNALAREVWFFNGPDLTPLKVETCSLNVSGRY